MTIKDNWMDGESMTDIPIEAQRQIIEGRIQQWKNTQYQSIIDLRVAEKIGDELMLVQAKKQIKNCEIALDVLGDELAGLDSGEGSGM